MNNIKKILLSKVMISIYVILVVVTAIYVISKIQLYNKYKNVYHGQPLTRQSEIKTYNVEGMTDEEIEELLKDGRDEW